MNWIEISVHCDGEGAEAVAELFNRLNSRPGEEDTAAVILRFTNGALGIVEATTGTRPVDLEGSLSILGERGTVVIGGFAANELVTWKFEDTSLEDATVIEESRTIPDNVYGFGHRRFLENVIGALRGRNKALVDGLEGRRSLELITAIYEAAETGRTVSLRFHPRFCKLGHGANASGEAPTGAP